MIIKPIHEKLLALVGTLECVSARHLHEIALEKGLHAQERWDPIRQQMRKSTGIGYSTARSMLQRLAQMGLVETQRFGVRGRFGQGYGLTELGRAATPGLAKRFKAPELTAEVGRRGWTRSEFWAFAARHDGITCDQSAEARESLAAATGYEIEHLRALSFDILRLQTATELKTWILVVDDPRKSPAELAAELPIHQANGPRIGVLVKPCDDGTVWQSEKGWIRIGKRFRDLIAHLRIAPQYKGVQPKTLRELGNVRCCQSALGTFVTSG